MIPQAKSVHTGSTDHKVPENCESSFPWAKIVAGTIGEVYFENRNFENKKSFRDYVSTLLTNGCPCRGFEKVNGKIIKSNCEEKTIDFRTNTAEWLNRHYKRLLKEARSKSNSEFPEIQFLFCPCGLAHK